MQTHEERADAILSALAQLRAALADFEYGSVNLFTLGEADSPARRAHNNLFWLQDAIASDPQFLPPCELSRQAIVDVLANAQLERAKRKAREGAAA